MKALSPIFAMCLGLQAIVCSAVGNPPMPDQGAAPQMPAHALEQAMASGPRGTLAVRAIQGTKGGPGVTGDEVEIVLFHRDQPFKQVKAVLDEHGVLMVGDLPVAMGVRPLVRIKHSGVLYQNAGPLMDAQKKDGVVDVTVYETTDEPPPWKVIARHAAAARVEGSTGLEVGETLVVENTGDRTWLGSAAGTDGRRTTVTTMLPPNATDVELGPGFHGWCCTALAENTLNIQMPLMPGRMTYQFGYRIPETDGKTELRLVNTVNADHVAIFIPDDGSTAESTLVHADGLDTQGPTPMRAFKADNVSAGEAAGVVLLRTSAAAILPTKPAGGVPVRYLLAAAGGLAVLGGLAALVLRKRSGSVAA